MRLITLPSCIYPMTHRGYVLKCYRCRHCLLLRAANDRSR